MATADLVDNVYRLNFSDTCDSKIERCCLASANTWHRRLGHINFNDLKKMTSGIVSGIDCQKNIKKQLSITCCEGKQTILPFRSGTRATGLPDLVYF